MQKKRSLRKGSCTTTPRVTQLTPKRKILCLRELRTASRKMPPKATLAPRLWQRGSSTTSQTAEPGMRSQVVMATTTRSDVADQPDRRAGDEVAEQLDEGD